jgi:hypothetical protein
MVGDCSAPAAQLDDSAQADCSAVPLAVDRFSSGARLDCSAPDDSPPDGLVRVDCSTVSAPAGSAALMAGDCSAPAAQLDDSALADSSAVPLAGDRFSSGARLDCSAPDDSPPDGSVRVDYSVVSAPAGSAALMAGDSAQWD